MEALRAGQARQPKRTLDYSIKEGELRRLPMRRSKKPITSPSFAVFSIRLFTQERISPQASVSAGFLAPHIGINFHPTPLPVPLRDHSIRLR